MGVPVSIFSVHASSSPRDARRRTAPRMSQSPISRPIDSTADTRTRELATSPAAMLQGPNRHARGLNALHMAQQVADSHGW